MSRLQLDRGDAIFLYTDGVTEAKNNENKMFGTQLLLRTLYVPGDNAEQEIQRVYEAVKEYAGSEPQSDDITILELIYHGSMQERKDSYENGEGK